MNSSLMAEGLENKPTNLIFFGVLEISFFQVFIQMYTLINLSLWESFSQLISILLLSYRGIYTVWFNIPDSLYAWHSISSVCKKTRFIQNITVVVLNY